LARYLVTGGAGFIGSNIVETLVERGEQVVVLDDFSTGKRENLEGFVNKVTLIEGSVADAVVREAVEAVDFVLHQGALASVPRSVDDPPSTNRANVDGTLNLLVAARDAGVKRVVFAASSSAYGDQPTLPKVETMPPMPLSPYAASKVACEYYCKAFTACYGLETVCLRYFNIFGPRQDPQSQYAAVIPRFITRMLDGKPPVIFGDGEQSRDFTYVADCVEANLLACEAPGAVGGTFNVACGGRYTLNQLVELLNDILGTDLQPIYEAERPGDVKHSQADITAARRALGYEPKVSFEDGLRRTVEWFKARRGHEENA